MLDLQNTLRTYQILCNSGKHSFISRFLVKSLSRVRLFATPWTAARQVLLSMGFSRQERWSGVPLPSLYLSLLLLLLLSRFSSA